MRIRRAQKRVKRRMQLLQFHRFSQRLVQTASFYPGAQVRRGSEAWTTRTCTGCGHLHPGVGGAKLFVCPHCHLQVGRDVNGARNFYLRMAAQA